MVVFAWLVAPILIAYFLSRTGRYESAHVLSSLALTGLVTTVAASTGGIESFAAIWLVVVPLEAALVGVAPRRRDRLDLCAGAAGLLVVLANEHLLPRAGPSAQAALAALGIVSAALYATGLALGAEALARTSFWLLYAEEDRYRLLARNMTDVITRHGRDGAVLFVSPAADTLFGSRVADLLGHGLFERVHVADRPAYLTALGDAAALGESRSSNSVSAATASTPTASRPRNSSGSRCAAARSTAAATAGERSARSSRSCATSPSASSRSRRLEEARAEAERANAAQEPLPRHHEPRIAHAAQCHHRLLGNADQRVGADARRQAPPRIRRADQRVRPSSAVGRQRHPRHVEDRDRQFRDHAGAVRAGAGRRGLLRDAGVARARGRRSSRTACRDDLPDMVADKRALKQILLNLLSNAIRFTDRGGKVTVSAPRRGGNVTFVVEDNGVGIGDDDLARIGEPFFQAAHPTIAATTAPASDFPSSRDWCGCMAANVDPQPGRRGHARDRAPAARLREGAAGENQRAPAWSVRMACDSHDVNRPVHRGRPQHRMHQQPGEEKCLSAATIDAVGAAVARRDARRFAAVLRLWTQAMRPAGRLSRFSRASRARPSPIVVNAVFLQIGRRIRRRFSPSAQRAMTADRRRHRPSRCRPIGRGLSRCEPHARGRSHRRPSSSVAAAGAAPRRNDPIADLIGPSRASSRCSARCPTSATARSSRPACSTDATSAAIEKFEREHKLPVTGRMSAIGWSASLRP